MANALKVDLNWVDKNSPSMVFETLITIADEMQSKAKKKKETRKATKEEIISFIK